MPSHLGFEPFSLKRTELLSATLPPRKSPLNRSDSRAWSRPLPLGYSLGRSLQPCTINTCTHILFYVKKKSGMEEKPHAIKIYFCFLKKEKEKVELSRHSACLLREASPERRSSLGRRCACQPGQGQGPGGPPPHASGASSGRERGWREGGGGRAARTDSGPAGQRRPLQLMLFLPGAWRALRGEGSPPPACAVPSLSGLILVGL